MTPSRSFLIAAAALITAAGCTSNKKAVASDDEPKAYEEIVVADTFESEPAPPDAATLSGPTTPEALLLFSSWREEMSEASAAIDAGAAGALSGVDPGARVTVYLGAWCPDSVREITRMWRALEEAGEPPFPIEYVALDRSFQAGSVDITDRAIVAVPTIVVERSGAEVGRIVERPVTSVEEDLLALLRGTKSGWVSQTRPAPDPAE